MKKEENYLFQGFTQKATDFLRDVRFHNSKDWYEENKEAYREYLLKPFQQLVMELSGLMASLDPQVDTRPAVDKTISRIRRDTRFSRDKTLYRDTMWISFRRPAEDWKLNPVYFFEISPAWYRYGMGFYSAPKASLDRLRELIDDNDREFLRLMDIFNRQKLFKLEGDNYKRILDREKPPEVLEWYQKRDLYICRTSTAVEALFSSRLISELTDGFMFLKPFYDFLWRLTVESRAV